MLATCVKRWLAAAMTAPVLCEECLQQRAAGACSSMLQARCLVPLHGMACTLHTQPLIMQSRARVLRMCFETRDTTGSPNVLISTQTRTDMRPRREIWLGVSDMLGMHNAAIYVAKYRSTDQESARQHDERPMHN